MLARRVGSRVISRVVRASSSTSIPATTESAPAATPIVGQQAPNYATPWSTNQRPRPATGSNPRFEQTAIELQPNPLSAMELIAREAVRQVHGRRAVCDGGGGPLGHPKIYINLDKAVPGTCGYCGLRFEQHVSIALGIIIGLIASFIQSLGLTIQRKSHVLNQLLPEDKQRVEHRRPLWLLGFAVFISSNILGSLVQIASLPVVILAPLGAVSLLWNAFFARLLLGDVFSPWMVLGTILIAGGAVLIAIFGIVPEPTRSLEDLLQLFRRPIFVAYFSLLGFTVLVCLAITHLAEYSLLRRIRNYIISPPSETPRQLDERAPLLNDRKSPLISPMFATSNPAINRTRILLAISYASFSGILSGMCLLFAKSGVELLLLTIRGSNQFWRWQAWMLVIGLVVFALLQLWYLHKALILADPTLVCPSAFCFYNLSSIINGLVYFDQFSLIAPVHLLLVVLGIGILLSGVWVVSIHSGGGGVDVGITFNEVTAVSPTSFVRSPTEEGDEASTEEWGTRSEPNLGSAGLSSPESILGLEFDGEGPFSPISTVTCPLPARVPLEGTSRETRVHGRHATYDSHMRHRRLYTNPLSPPMNTVATLTGAGLQIGLSPLSPGFSILPRRRVSQVGLNTGMKRRPGGDLERRRTVSEGYTQREEAVATNERRGHKLRWWLRS